MTSITHMYGRILCLFYILFYLPAWARGCGNYLFSKHFSTFGHTVDRFMLVICWQSSKGSPLDVLRLPITVFLLAGTKVYCFSTFYYVLFLIWFSFPF